MDSLGYGPATLASLNPRLVSLSISGFGHDGPEGRRAGYDQIAQGEAGIMSLTGPNADEPQRVGVPIGDLLAGIYGVVGVLAALLERNATEKGSVVRTSLLAALVGVHAFEGTRWTVAGQIGAAAGNHHPSISPYGLFRCDGGSVQIAVGSESLWRRFATAFGLDLANARFATNGDRVRNLAELTAAVEEAFAGYKAPVLLALLEEIGIPSGRVRRLDEVYEWEQTRSQGLVVGVNHSTLGPIELPGPTLRFFDEAGTEHTRRSHLPPPTLDEHGTSLRGEFEAVR
jgi:formyl-CoA transferase